MRTTDSTARTERSEARKDLRDTIDSAPSVFWEMRMVTGGINDSVIEMNDIGVYIQPMVCTIKIK